MYGVRRQDWFIDGSHSGRYEVRINNKNSARY